MMPAPQHQHQNRRQRQQINQSAARLSWRGFKEWVFTEAGREKWTLSSVMTCSVVAVVAASIIFYRVGRTEHLDDLQAQLATADAALAHEIRENSRRIDRNGCLLMVLLNVARPETFAPAPDWCGPLINEIPGRRAQP